ncbi:elongation factor-like protein, partial [Volvox carteri f. nagariensis]
LHLVVLGHVDAGKSSLMGRLLHELGLVSARDAHKYQRDAAAAGKGSFAWAWVLDERPEERERGVTVDVAMTRFTTRRFSVTLLDAPGHRDFVPNMIAGAAQADAALLLVDGSPGGFEAGFSEGTGGLHGTPGGQTREHAALARSLGIEQMAIVVSKLDTVGYDKARFDAIRTMLLPYLKSVGFKESSLQWLPASGPLGENLVGPPQDPALAAWWSSGLSVVAAIDNFIPRERATSRPLRMPITDVFKSAVVLGGKVEGGALRPGSKVVLVPGPGQPFTVRSLEVSGSPSHLARASDSCEVALVGGHHHGAGGGGGGGGAFDPASVAPGAVLCHPDFPAVLVTRFELRVVVLDTPVPLLRGHVVTLHAHAAREEGHITALTATLDPRTGEVVKSRPRCLTKGQIALLEVTAARGLVLEEYSEYRALGRVALREGGRTLAVGIVTRLLQ